MSSSIYCHVRCLPKDADERTFRDYLEREACDLISFEILEMQSHKRSSSAILKLSKKEAVKLLAERFSVFPFESKFLTIGKTQPPSKMVSSPSNIQGPHKSTIEWTEISRVAKKFHKYICETESLANKAIDRDRVKKIFQQFCTIQSIPYSLRNESMVMTRLRSCKLLRSKRISESTVLVAIADQSGIFPSVDALRDHKNDVLQARATAESDKNGVVIINANRQSVSPSEQALMKFTVEANDDAVLFLKAELSGPQIMKQFAFAKSMTFPIQLSSIQIVELVGEAEQIGLYRVNITFHFQGKEGPFTIARPATFECITDKNMAEALKPKTSYSPRKYKAFEHPPLKVFEPPIHQTSGSNPFRFLSHHRIPCQIKELLVSGELENELVKPEDSDNPLQEYANFWKTLLWASEYQASRDIQIFDLFKVQLSRIGRLFCLKVPGLAENRPSVLRGDLVNITWNKHLYKGQVKEVRLDDVLLDLHNAFKENYNPDLDLVDVRFTFSRTTFRTSHEGCVQAEQVMKNALLFPVDDDLIPLQPRTEQSSAWSWTNRSLNQEQINAVKAIVRGLMRPLPYIIFGPPGTGKTTTLIETVCQLARQPFKPRILLVAPSNDAADLLVERLAVVFPPSELRRILAYSRSIEAVPSSIRQYVHEGHSPELQLAAVMSARIVVATVNFAARLSYIGVHRGHFNVVCVDEAGHATEPEVVSVIASLMDFTQKNAACAQVVLAGDPRQLGPIVTSKLCLKFGLEISYLERLTLRRTYGKSENGKYPEDLITMLVRNYRSHHAILKLPNEMFYDGALRCCSDFMISHSMSKWEHLPRIDFPVLFHAVQGENLREGHSPSWFNPQEVMLVVEYVKCLVKDTRPPLKSEEIGIVTPYHCQARKIRGALMSLSLNDIKVGSVESFQGQERRCIILSTVRAETQYVSSDLKYNLGIVANAKRFNVAVTRAKALLIVIGCPEVLALDKANWLPFLEYCHENQSWRGEPWIPDSSDISTDEIEVDWDLVCDNISSEGAEEVDSFAFIHCEE